LATILRDAACTSGGPAGIAQADHQVNRGSLQRRARSWLPAAASDGQSRRNERIFGGRSMPHVTLGATAPSGRTLSDC